MIKQFSRLLSILPVSLIFYFDLFECFWGLSSIDENTNGFVFKKSEITVAKKRITIISVIHVIVHVTILGES